MYQSDQVQDSVIVGNVVPAGLITGVLSSGEHNITDIHGYVELASAVCQSDQVQDSIIYGSVTPVSQPPEPIVKRNVGGTGKYFGPHGIAVTADLLNGKHAVTEETQFNFFDETDKSQLERFLEIEPKPVEEEVDTSMSFLKSLPAPKVDTTMSFIKSLNQPKALIEKEIDPAMKVELDILEEMKNAVLDNTLTEVIQPVAKPLTEAVQSDKFWKTISKTKH